MRKKLFFLIALGVFLLGLVVFLRVSPDGTRMLWEASNGGTWLLPLVGVAALIDSINPCAFSILLLTIGFLLSLGKIRSRIVIIGGAYVAGIFFVYILIGLGILQTLHLFDTPHFMARVGAVFLILLGSINLINELVPSFPVKLRIPQSVHGKMAGLMERASLPTAFFLGILVGLCEFPCTGGPYLMVLGLLHDQGTYIAGVGYLLLYNLIFILPLVVILLIASDSALVDRVYVWKKSMTGNMRIGAGIAMIGLGLLVLFL